MSARVLLGVALAAVLLVASDFSTAGRQAEACAFLRTPYVYEAEQARLTYLATIDAASINQLYPGNPFFGLPAIETGGRAARAPGPARAPATLLKSIAWIESTMTMAHRNVTFEATGPALVSFDCGHGIMQVTTGMTVPLGGTDRPSANQVMVATHYGYNIARGAVILAEKWNEAPERRPIAGTDTNSDPTLVENWYFATWAYNGFTGPGANVSNHPLDPSFGAFPRPTFQCEGNQSRSRYPYQELAWGCMATPPTRNGAQLWTPLAASLPNTTLPQWFAPLQLSNFAFPYAGMDIPTPQPAHVDAVPALRPDLLKRGLGTPTLGVSSERVTVSAKGRPEDARATIRVQNAGTGLLIWSAAADDKWLVVDPPAGVALGSDLTCRQDCASASTITVTVNPTLLSSASAVGSLRIASPNGGGERVVRVEVDASFEVGAPGVSRGELRLGRGERGARRDGAYTRGHRYSKALCRRCRLPIPIVGSWLDAVRRNHALEHATATILLARLGPRRLAGRASGDGFFLMGDVTAEEVADSAREALTRLQNGESTLAVSPHCGTNIAMAGLLAAGAASMTLARGRGQFGNAFIGAMLGVVLSQPLGRLVQRHLTTRADLDGVEVVGMRTHFGALHKVRTRAR